MPVERVPIEAVKKGSVVIEQWSGALCTVKKVRIEGESVVLEIGQAWCLAIEGPRGSVIGVWRRQRRAKAKDKENG